MGELGDNGVLSGSLRAPLTVTRIFLDPARSRCSHSQTPCQVPRFSLPSETGTVKLDPRKHAFTCAGWKKNMVSNLSDNYYFRELLKLISSWIYETLPCHQVLRMSAGKAYPLARFGWASFPCHLSRQGPNSRWWPGWLMCVATGCASNQRQIAIILAAKKLS